MVLAPHPDDESLATAGILQRACALGAETRVLFVTDGENNPWPQRALEWRWRITEADRARWGMRRRAEALSALSCLGVPRESVRFLGYPDQGLCDLLMTDPDPLLDNLVREIASWKPSILVDPVPADRHPDHGALAVLTDFALAQPALKDVTLTHLRYFVHGSLRGAPDRLVRALHLTAPEQDRKRHAILKHRSQLLLGGHRNLRFARSEECYLPVTRSKALDACHNITMCRLDRRSLHLTIGKSRRLGIGPQVIQLAIVIEDGLTIRVDVPVPARNELVPARNASTGGRIADGRFTKTRTETQLALSLPPNAPARMAYVKLDRPSERRLGFFDSVGWRSVPVAPTQHQAEVEGAAPRAIAVEPYEVAVP
jgi:LmbE family N-acetylglucosaminyl deacetylase